MQGTNNSQFSGARRATGRTWPPAQADPCQLPSAGNQILSQFTRPSSKNSHHPQICSLRIDQNCNWDMYKILIWSYLAPIAGRQRIIKHWKVLQNLFGSLFILSLKEDLVYVYCATNKLPCAAPAQKTSRKEKKKRAGCRACTPVISWLSTAQPFWKNWAKS